MCVRTRTLPTLSYVANVFFLFVLCLQSLFRMRVYMGYGWGQEGCSCYTKALIFMWSNHFFPMNLGVRSYLGRPPHSLVEIHETIASSGSSVVFKIYV